MAGPKNRRSQQPARATTQEPAEIEETKPFRINQWDANKVKQTLDECLEKVAFMPELHVYLIAQIMTKARPANYKFSNMRIGLSIIAVVFALVAQFFPLPFPANYNLLVVCVVGYPACINSICFSNLLYFP